MALQESLIFAGRLGEDVTLFLQCVKRVAFAQGRQRDNEWLVDYAETCLTGKALVWYTTLSKGVRTNFASLRIAMIDHFAAAADIALTPAAAAPLSPRPLSSSLPYGLGSLDRPLMTLNVPKAEADRCDARR
ncbi:hypothetical protein FRB95_009939 [Tulasnella sp. JGI-2019a]|nr:hypothetical protein FRB95_009939 [Tulasnella sp. JGI-2019a]